MRASGATASQPSSLELKLDVLPFIICKNLKANSIGEFNQQGLRLVTEKLVGGQKACLGFTKEPQANGYLPNTLLKGDIRQFTNNNLRIIATFRKNLQDLEYQEITYIAKKVEWNTLTFPDQYEPLRQQIIQTLQLSDST